MLWKFLFFHWCSMLTNRKNSIYLFFILAIKRVRVNYDDNNSMKYDPINADCGWLYTSNIENKHIVTWCYEIFLYAFFGSRKCFFLSTFFVKLCTATEHNPKIKKNLYKLLTMKCCDNCSLPLNPLCVLLMH